ncbi:hypothetical protein BI364_10405 [Acidihalobacter yilgarnensis]|uniref:MPN domain-containing protein n=1 Tax=Acidihalobacter yilgarnensis TaxID=2819280 RepID=A0A1D8IP88_9GAMM|nr:hypothetical protein BI364_10405 [Acidihalobacter yilgarnensis]
MSAQQQGIEACGFVRDAAGNYWIAQTVSPDEIIEQARQILAERVRRESVIDCPQTARDFVTMSLTGRQSEVFCVMWLDNRHQIIAFDELFQGTIDGCSVHPREVVRAALHHNAAACILTHNHPSGVAEPSRADQAITDKLKQALGLIDVRVLDHLVVGGAEVTSMAERGQL